MVAAVFDYKSIAHRLKYPNAPLLPDRKPEQGLSLLRRCPPPTQPGSPEFIKAQTYPLVWKKIPPKHPFELLSDEQLAQVLAHPPVEELSDYDPER